MMTAMEGGPGCMWLRLALALMLSTAGVWGCGADPSTRGSASKSASTLASTPLPPDVAELRALPVPERAEAILRMTYPRQPEFSLLHRQFNVNDASWLGNSLTVYAKGVFCLDCGLVMLFADPVDLRKLRAVANP